MVLSPQLQVSAEAEVCRHRLVETVRRHDLLVVNRQQAERESAGHKQRAKSHSVESAQSKQTRYEILRRTRDINTSLQRVDHEINMLANAYSQALLLPFCHALLAKLPREIRDYIYEYLLDRVALRNFKLDLTHRNMPKKMWELQPTVFPWTWTGSKKLHHYEDHHFVSLDFARELVEMYYRRCIFSIHEESFHILDRFLQQDPFRYDLVVGHNLCRFELRLAFRYPGMALDFDAGGYIVDMERTKAEAISQTDAISKTLTPLYRIKQRCRVKFTFSIWTGAIGIFQFSEMSRALIPIVTKLKDNGCSIKYRIDQVQLMSYGSGRCTGTWDFGDDCLTKHQSLEDIVMELGTSQPQDMNEEVVRAFEAHFAPPNNDFFAW